MKNLPGGIMKKLSYHILISLGFVFCLLQCTSLQQESDRNDFEITAYKDGRPYTRWWWHAMKFTREDIENQLVWLRDQGFGGVEISFIYPVNRDPDGDRFEWLGEQWQEMVVYSKRCADSLGLGCDFTYGTLWPFGGTFVSDEDRTRIWGDSSYRQPLRLSWTHPDTGNVVNHMDSEAFRRYAEVMSPAFEPAMKGGQSAFFCDSWEVHTHKIWTPGFEKIFEERFGYDIIPFMDDIFKEENGGPRYDYMKLVADLVLHEFYIPFHEETRRMGGISRAQTAGSPTDLIRAYAAIDIPETEAMLYEPNYSNIVASAAALSGKPYVSSESFTCLYGWPADYMFHEQTADLKMVADALFANGVNLHIWHGTPFNPIGVDTIYFYATVHVGTTGSLTDELIPFNEYLTKVSNAMRFGRTYSDIAVYLPLEDSWFAGILPEELQMPWSWGAYELRYEYFPDELEGFHPLWINTYFLEQAEVKDGIMKVNDMLFDALYVDVSYLDLASLKAIKRVAGEGLPVYLKSHPAQAGKISDDNFNRLLDELLLQSNVHVSFTGVHPAKPLVEGENLPEFRVRTDGKELKIFFSNPTGKGLKYPLSYGQSFQEGDILKEVTINHAGHIIPLELRFKPYQSLLLNIDNRGRWKFEDIEFIPKPPVREIPNQ
jgi:hypothetical protein